MTLRFDSQVAVITGAGGGLGKAYAILLSSLGAKVVVNDAGSSPLGEKLENKRLADTVVNEITRNGGVAVANYDSVEFGNKIIDTAINNYGRIDILINNAGILRDKSFAKMTVQDWDLVMLLQLKGSFICCKAAWPHMIRQRYGRIINTASAAGLYGNFGQAIYSAAKLALVGFSKSIAAEGVNKNVFCNVIAPLAAAQMAETKLSKSTVEALTPAYVAPVVGYLCHETCKDNGEVIECGAGWIARVRWQRAKGVQHKKGFTIDDVAREWIFTGDFAKDATYPTSLQDSFIEVTRSMTSEPFTNNLFPIYTEETTVPKSDKIFNLIDAYINNNKRVEGAKLVNKVGYKYLFNVDNKKDGHVKTSWTIDLKNGTGSILRGEHGETDAVFTMTEDDTVKVFLGELDPQLAFVQGNIKIKGNMTAATKFSPSFFPKISTDLLNIPLEVAVKKYLGVKEPVKAGVDNYEINDLSSTGLQSEPILKLMQQYLSSETVAREIVKKVGCVYQFDLMPSKGTTPVHIIIQLKTEPAYIKVGTIQNPNAKFIMLDSDFIDLVKGKINTRMAFIQGRIKITGNIRSAMKFNTDIFPKVSAL